MFTWINKQGVQSDRGFIVQFVSRFKIVYREGTNSRTIPFEAGMLGEESCVIVDPHAFRRWDSDSTSAVIPVEKQQEIPRNFTEALQFQNLEISVEAVER